MKDRVLVFEAGRYQRYSLDRYLPLIQVSDGKHFKLIESPARRTVAIHAEHPGRSCPLL